MMPTLPPPDADQLATSQQLGARIAAEIDAAGGWIGFDRWMARTLYEPGLGYYSGGSRKFGAAGDFVTAPELSPLFGQCMAVQLAQWFEQGAPQTIFEFGAGTGSLAATILESLSGAGLDEVAYRFVDLSGELRGRQRETLAARVPHALERVEWLDALPDRIEGIVLGNELLDAMPVRLFRLLGEQVLERGVARARIDEAGSDKSGEPGPPNQFVFSDRPADPSFSAAVRTTLHDSGWAAQGGWPDGYVSELGEQAAAWVETVSQRLAHGALLLLDYGFPRAEFFHPQRAEGTLMCHYRHHGHGDPFWLPGLQDITGHIDFSAVSTAARAGGLEPLGYCSQASFLIDCGIAQFALREPQHDVLRWASQASALQRLLSEAEMGELFKAIAFARGIPDEAIGFARGDRRGALQSAPRDDSSRCNPAR